jgi:peptidoglycan/LPS O-acetylase OafA/YrhL
LFFGSIVGWLSYETAAWFFGRPIVPTGTYFKRPESLQDAIIGALFVAQLVGFNAASAKLSSFLVRHTSAVRWLAGGSFTLYLCHMPVAQFLLACMPWGAQDPRTRVVVFIGTLVVVIQLAACFERRKTFWRTAFSALLAVRAGSLQPEHKGPK